MRFSEAGVGGGAQPPPHPALVTPSPSRVMGESEVRRIDVQMRLGGLGGVCECVGLGGWGGHCLAKMLPMNFTTFGRSKIKRE